VSNTKYMYEGAPSLEGQRIHRVPKTQGLCVRCNSNTLFTRNFDGVHTCIMCGGVLKLD
jgi:hypothetical protein